MAFEHLYEMTVEQLLKKTDSRPSIGNPDWDATKVVLQVKLAQEQSRAAADLVAATNQLVSVTDDLGKFTRRLVFATWGLVGVTVLLFAAAAVQLGWTILHPGKQEIW